jgi:hypothetical protein
VTDLPNEAVKKDVSSCNAKGISQLRLTILDAAGDPKLKNIAVAKLQFYKKG